MNKTGDIFDPEILIELVNFSKICKKYKKKSFAIYRNKEELEKLIELDINYPIASVDTNIFIKALAFHSEIYKNSLKYDLK